VAILADGAVVPREKVVGGKITLPVAASKVTVGLPITADLQTLPLAYDQAPAFGQGRPKNVSKAFLRVYRSSGVYAGPDLDTLREYKQRTNEPYGSPPRLVTDEIEVMLSSNWNNSGQVFVRQTDPLPLTVAAITLEAAVGG
jgi:hypothetical protein